MTVSTVTVRVPWTLRKRGGRKQVVTPDGTLPVAVRPRVDDAVIKAIARAYRWKRMLETGPYTSLRDLAAAEKINESYLARVLRLTLLAPDIIEAILHGEIDVELAVLLKTVRSIWKEQKEEIQGLGPLAATWKQSAAETPSAERIWASTQSRRTAREQERRRPPPLV
jgi:hypothetical protein